MAALRELLLAGELVLADPLTRLRLGIGDTAAVIFDFGRSAWHLEYFHRRAVLPLEQRTDVRRRSGLQRRR